MEPCQGAAHYSKIAASKTPLDGHGMVIKAFNGKCNDADSSIKGSNPGAGKLITRGRVAGVTAGEELG